MPRGRKMKKAILKNVILTVFVALLINSAISCFIISSQLMKNTKENMLYTLEILDNSLDYTIPLQNQIETLETYVSNPQMRFTVITVGGEVCADSNVQDTSNMENHSGRKEFMDAAKYGNGYAKRYSETLEVDMFYAAALSSDGKYLLRVALPYTGTGEYVAMMMPAFFMSFLSAIGIGAVFAAGLSRHMIKPVKDIAREMSHLQDMDYEFQFQSGNYEELDVIVDTTKKMATDVKDYIKQLELEKQVRQEFFSNASHELKTPLTSIKGYTELLENGMAADEAAGKEFLARIRREAENMTSLINDILMISRLETKEAEVVMSEVRMDSLLKEIMEELQMLAVKQQVEITWESKEIVFYANPQQLKELISNLAANAIQYNRIGGKVHVSVDKVREEIIIQVFDTGMGIPEESLPRVFERFYRVDKGRSKKAGGTGLGLSIVKHVVGYYGGTIDVQSKTDIGTTFTVRLPDKSNRKK